MRYYAKLLRSTLTASLMLVVITGAAAAGKFEDAKAALNRRDYTTGLRLLRPLAEQGDAAAQFVYGMLYFKGQVAEELRRGGEVVSQSGRTGRRQRAGHAASPSVAADHDVERIVARHVASIVPPDGAGGAAVALRIDGQSLFFNYGWADRANKRPIMTDTLFNLASLRKVFEATLLAQAVLKGELALDDPVAKYVVELQQGGDIRQVTLGQLATHTSGLLLPQDHPPWPDWGYTLPEFIDTLNAWKADSAPGQHHLYTHAGFVLLQLAFERPTPCQ